MMALFERRLGFSDQANSSWGTRFGEWLSSVTVVDPDFYIAGYRFYPPEPSSHLDAVTDVQVGDDLLENSPLSVPSDFTNSHHIGHIPIECLCSPYEHDLFGLHFARQHQVDSTPDDQL